MPSHRHVQKPNGFFLSKATLLETDAPTQLLTVTVYGVTPYTASDIANDPEGVLRRSPAVISRFVVAPN